MFGDHSCNGMKRRSKESISLSFFLHMGGGVNGLRWETTSRDKNLFLTLKGKEVHGTWFRKRIRGYESRERERG